jgi:hypothetical protein
MIRYMASRPKVDLDRLQLWRLYTAIYEINELVAATKETVAETQALIVLTERQIAWRL